MKQPKKTRSVRIDDTAWGHAETMAEMWDTTTSAVLRAGIEALTKGLHKDLRDNQCPMGHELLIYHTDERVKGDLVTCWQDLDGSRCGYSFIWDARSILVNRMRERKEAESRKNSASS
jgi:hypothetical protein